MSNIIILDGGMGRELVRRKALFNNLNGRHSPYINNLALCRRYTKILSVAVHRLSQPTAMQWCLSISANNVSRQRVKVWLI